MNLPLYASSVYILKFICHLENISLINLLVVCYEHDRDEIRSRLIGWLQNQDISLKGVEGYKNLLKSYFHLVDENEDGKLDTTEFREFVAANQSTDEVLPRSDICLTWLSR